MTIVVAFDGSAIALHALSTALDLAKALRGAPIVHVATVVDYLNPPAGLAKAPPEAPDLLASEAETAIAVAQELASTRGQTIAGHILRGPVVDTLLEFAHDAGASYVVVGTHGRKGLQRAIMGSTCEGLIRHSDIPVLTVHRP